MLGCLLQATVQVHPKEPSHHRVEAKSCTTHVDEKLHPHDAVSLALQPEVLHSLLDGDCLLELVNTISEIFQLACVLSCNKNIIHF